MAGVDWQTEAVTNDYVRSLEAKVMDLEALRVRDTRWLEDERRALSVTYSDERPDYPFWVSVIGMICVCALLLTSVYLIAAGMGL